MYKFSFITAVSFITLSLASCGTSQEKKKQENAGKGDTVATAASETVHLPAPYETKSSMTFSDVIGWPADKTPTAPEGFNVTKFAGSLDNPRWIIQRLMVIFLFRKQMQKAV